MAPSLPLDVALHAHCLSPEERAAAADALAAAASGALPPAAAWRFLARRCLRPEHPFPLHRALYAAAYASWDPSAQGPRPVWIPGAEEALETNAAGFMASFHGDAWWRRRRSGHPSLDWPLLQRVSVQSPELFWSALLRDALRVRFDAPPTRVLDEAGLLGDGGAGCCCGGGGGGGAGCCGGGGKGDNGEAKQCAAAACCSKAEQPPVALGPDSVRWLPGARLNVAAAALLTPKSPDGGGDGGESGESGSGNGGKNSNSNSNINDPWSASCCDGEDYESGASSSPPHALIWAEDGRPDAVRRVSWPALRARAARVARALARAGVKPGESVAIDMPMSCDAVAIYLGIVLQGSVVVSIADSFAPSEIAVRLRVSGAVAVFTQDLVSRGRGNAPLPLFEKVAEARAPRAVVLPAARVGKAWGGAEQHEHEHEQDGGLSGVALRPGDLSWGEFLSLASPGGASDDAPPGAPTPPPPFAPCSLPGDAPSNVLFSSGTTGEPKAVAWSHVTPLRAAADAWAHQDVRRGDVLCWPTNLGWMMGPWLVYAALLNGAAIALYHGPPGGADFCAFVASARVTQLGLVPSIVRGWRAARGLLGPADEGGGGAVGAASGASAGSDGDGKLFLPDWSALRCFSSTGEASAPDDYHWLASRVRGYRPVVEYCGGTEIGGGFLSGSLLQPQAPSAFSTPTLGAALVLLGAEELGGGQSPHGAGAPPFVGELTLVPPLLGSSQHLLNRDHAATYYAGMPRCLPPRADDDASGGDGPPSGLAGRRLRRHGDEFARLPGGYYQALGRVDDTMNLGGIKVSSAELERCVLERVPSIGEAAAVGAPSPGGGPERLVLFVVLSPAAAAAASTAPSGGPAPPAAGQEQGAAAANTPTTDTAASSSPSPPGTDTAASDPAASPLRAQCQRAVREGLNPLFRVAAVVAVGALPRTASGKVVRRALRERAAGAAGAPARARM